MKTLKDLRDLLPEILDFIESLNPEVGNERPVETCETFEKDGWEITVEFQTYGDFINSYDDEDWLESSELVRAWRTLTYLSACHLDESGEYTEFTAEQLAPIFREIDEAIAEYEPAYL